MSRPGTALEGVRMITVRHLDDSRSQRMP